MAKSTPEGQVKKDLRKILDSLGDSCFYYMPVQNGMGQTGIPDFMVTVYGVTVAIECKATPKQHPTTLQAFALERIHKAGGVAWVVDNESIELAKGMLTNIDSSGSCGGYEVEVLSREESLAPLYRWRPKLEVMEFNDGSCS